MQRRLGELEAKTRKRVAVVQHAYPDDPDDQALARHLVSHPEDRDAELTVFIRRFAKPS